MRSINKVILVGNLTRDPEMRRTEAAQYITTFGMATNREWMTKDGRKQQSSEFHEVVCFARLAEIAHQYLKKGKLVYIEGYLKTRSWDDVSGMKKFRTEVVAEDLIMLEKRPSDDRIPGQISEPNKGISLNQAEPDMQPSVTMEDPLTL